MFSYGTKTVVLTRQNKENNNEIRIDTSNNQVDELNDEIEDSNTAIQTIVQTKTLSLFDEEITFSELDKLHGQIEFFFNNLIYKSKKAFNNRYVNVYKNLACVINNE